MVKTVRVLTEDEVDCDPNIFPWVNRIFFVTTEELRNQYRASYIRQGRSVCPVTDFLSANLDKDVIDLEEIIYSNKNTGPEILCEVIRVTIIENANVENGNFLAKWAQHYCALQLFKYHYNNDNARGFIEKLLKHKETIFVSKEALYIVTAILNNLHPNPKTFLQSSDVINKYPDEFEPALFSAPDF